MENTVLTFEQFNQKVVEKSLFLQRLGPTARKMIFEELKLIRIPGGKLELRIEEISVI